MGEEAGQEMEHELVRDRAELRDSMRDRVGDDRHLGRDVERLAGVGGEYGAGRIELRVTLAQRVELLPHPQEPTVVGVLPVAAGTLALLDDLSDCGQRRVEPGDRDHLRPVQQLGGGLGARRPDEHGPLAEPRDERPQPVLDPAVEVTDGQELLTARHQLLLGQRHAWRRAGNEPLGVLPLHSLRALEVQEVQQRPLAERDQIELDPGWEVARALREVGAAQVGRRPDRGHHVRHQRQMEHLLDRDSPQDLAPPLDRLRLFAGQALAGPILEAELREQVLAHDHVLQLRRLLQQEPQILAMRHHYPRLCHTLTSGRKNWQQYCTSMLTIVRRNRANER